MLHCCCCCCCCCRWLLGPSRGLVGPLMGHAAARSAAFGQAHARIPCYPSDPSRGPAGPRTGLSSSRSTQRSARQRPAAAPRARSAGRARCRVGVGPSFSLPHSIPSTTRSLQAWHSRETGLPGAGGRQAGASGWPARRPPATHSLLSGPLGSPLSSFRPLAPPGPPSFSTAGPLPAAGVCGVGVRHSLGAVDPAPPLPRRRRPSLHSVRPSCAPGSLCLVSPACCPLSGGAPPPAPSFRPSSLSSLARLRRPRPVARSRLGLPAWLDAP